MPQAKVPYECPRCGYSTQRKPAMRKHLYDLVKVCPGQKQKIELTPEIKEEILRDRVYQVQTVSTQDKGKCTLNFSNCVFGMDATDKIEAIPSRTIMQLDYCGYIDHDPNKALFTNPMLCYDLIAFIH